jgi:hypothetical protein
LKLLIAGIKKFEENYNVSVNLECYGPTDSISDLAIRKASSEGMRIFHFGNLPREQVWRVQCSADALVLFSWTSNGTALGHIPLRYYEFLSTGNPIISMHDSDNAFVPENPSPSVNKASEINEVVKFLITLHESHRSLSKFNESIQADLTYASRAKSLKMLLDKIKSEGNSI